MNNNRLSFENYNRNNSYNNDNDNQYVDINVNNNNNDCNDDGRDDDDDDDDNNKVDNVDDNNNNDDDDGDVTEDDTNSIDEFMNSFATINYHCDQKTINHNLNNEEYIDENIVDNADYDNYDDIELSINSLRICCYDRLNCIIDRYKSRSSIRNNIDNYDYHDDNSYDDSNSKQIIRNRRRRSSSSSTRRRRISLMSFDPFHIKVTMNDYNPHC
jgi:hypothetical protein